MGDRPYTDDDLRAEAARQLANAVEDPDYMGVGEQMDDETVPSLAEHGSSWGDLLSDNDALYDEAQGAIHDLINGAADVSEWAIDLGADGLEPSDEHVITLDGDDKPIARIHFAFEPGMPDHMRDAFVQGIGEAINAHL